MRFVAGILLGLLIGGIAAAVWYGFNFVWNGYVYDYVAYFLGSPECSSSARGCWDGKSFNLIQLAPIFAGMFIAYLAIGFFGAVIQQYIGRHVSSSAAGWTAAVVFILFSLAIALLLVLMSYAGLKGFAAFFLYAYALGMFLGPSWAAFAAARTVHRGL